MNKRRADPIDGQGQAAHNGLDAGQHNGHHPVGVQVGIGQFSVGCFKFLHLVAFRIVRSYHPQPGEILTGHTVEIIGELLQLLEFGECQGDADADNQ
ncbi:hypothetical protein D3C75_741420 [compost metagenome]